MALAVALATLVAGAVALGRWERRHAVGSALAGLATTRQEIGDLSSERLRATYTIGSLRCLTYDFAGPERASTLCFDSRGGLKEAYRFRAENDTTWSILDDSARPTTTVAPRLVRALGSYRMTRTALEQTATALHGDVEVCAFRASLALRQATRDRQIASARGAFANCARESGLIWAEVRGLPRASVHALGRLPAQYASALRSQARAAGRLAARLRGRGPRMTTRQALTEYRADLRRFRRDAARLARELAQVLQRQRNALLSLNG